MNKKENHTTIGFIGIILSIVAFFVFAVISNYASGNYKWLVLGLPLSSSIGIGSMVYGLTGKIKRSFLAALCVIAFFLYIVFGPMP